MLISLVFERLAARARATNSVKRLISRSSAVIFASAAACSAARWRRKVA